MLLERQSGVPLYQQLKKALRQRIETGEWRAGQRIPSEPELCETLGIARGTVRSAIAELVHEGWLERRHGDGTFVARRRLDQRLSGFYSFAREARERGLEITSNVREWATVPAGEWLSWRLGVEIDSEVLRVVRVRSLQAQPILIETCHLPLEVAAPLTREDFSHGALYDALEERCALRVERAEESFEAVSLGAEEARLLEATPGAPALRVERVAYVPGDRPIELRLGIIRGDRCRYHVELR